MDDLIIKASDWDGDRALREAWLAWVRGLGLDTRALAATIMIRQAEHGYELHAKQHERLPSGAFRLDPTREHLVETPVVVQLGTERTWPEVPA